MGKNGLKNKYEATYGNGKDRVFFLSTNNFSTENGITYGTFAESIGNSG